MNRDRRRMLGGAAGLGLLGAAGLLAGAGQATGSDYRALVVLFLTGGNGFDSGFLTRSCLGCPFGFSSLMGGSTAFCQSAGCFACSQVLTKRSSTIISIFGKA